MRLSNWIVFLASFAVLAWILITLNIWGEQWKDLFFYLDNWVMWVGLFVGLIFLKMFFSWVLKLELKVLK